MSSPRLKCLDQGIRQQLAQFLIAHNFELEPSKRTFRRKRGDFTQIINIQLGSKSLTGKFTVNLGVFHPSAGSPIPGHPTPSDPGEADCPTEMRARLGMIRDSMLGRLFRVRPDSSASFLKSWLSTPFDKWWPYTDAPKQIERELASVIRLLEQHGLAWLESKSDLAVLDNALQARRDRIARHRGRGAAV